MRYYPDPYKAIDLSALIDAVKAAFRDHGTNSCQMPPKTYIDLPGGDFRTMPAYVPGLKSAGVKIVNVHPDNHQHQLPTVMALTILLDPQTGEPTAILNATALTDLRTGASAAVATEALASGKGGDVGLIGAGRQAAAGLRAIAKVYNILGVKVWSRNEHNAEKFAAAFPSYDIRVSNLKAAADAEVLLTTTPSRYPLVQDDWISDGTHINAIGADAPGKQELDPRILARSQIFVDDITQAVHSGEVNVPLQKGLLLQGDISGTLGEVIIGRKRRETPEEITIFDSTGIAITDLAIASLAQTYSTYIDLPFNL
jgi:alanine dehydrogenase